MPGRPFDVVIHGAGPVGATLALALQGSGLSVGLVASRHSAATPSAIRPIALSHASRLILERAGAWDALSPTPIEQIHVSQAGGFGRTRISREDLGLPALGYVASYEDIAAGLANRLAASNVHASNTQEDAEGHPRARLVVHAEGSRGNAVAKDYGHSAIVTIVESDRPAHGTAWERFTTQGPLALLPVGKKYAVVWSRATDTAAALMQADDPSFLKELQSTFGLRAGRFLSVGERNAAALVLLCREPRAIAGEIYIGNAAQTLHPVAGQGLNLGLRDAWALACLLRETPREALGSAPLAERFTRARLLDARVAIRGTDLLATLYIRRDPLSAVLRGAALSALDLFPPARRSLAKRMIYGASAW